MGCVNRKTATIEVNKKNPNQQYDVLKEEKNIPIDKDKKENNNNQLKKEEINDNETAKKEEEIKLPQKEEVIITNKEEEIKNTQDNQVITQSKNTEQNEHKEEEIKSPRKKVKKEKKLLEIIKNNEWTNSKSDFLLSCKRALVDTGELDSFTVGIRSITSITKTDYSDFDINQQYEISLLKSNINLNWAKPPYNKAKQDILEAIPKNVLISKYEKINWEFRSYNQYEKYTSKVKMLKISTANKDLEHFTFSGDDINKPVLLLIFSFKDLQSIYLFKEILLHHKEHKDVYDFIPLYGPVLESAKNSVYAWELGEKIGLPQQDLEMYFVENNTLNKMFGYITDDNMRTVIPKVIAIDSQKIIRTIETPQHFSVNVIENLSLQKNEYVTMKQKIIDTVNKYNMMDNLDSSPLSCDLTLRRLKVYKYDKTIDSLVPSVTYYDSLCGDIKTYNIDNNNKFVEDLSMVSKYIAKKELKDIKISSEEKNNIITKELSNFLTEVGLSDIKYQGIITKSKTIMSIAPNDFDSNQKFSIKKSKNVKLEFSLGNDLFESQFQMAITGQMNVLSEYCCFGKIDYMSAIPIIGSIFPSSMSLVNTETKEEETVTTNPDGDKPSIIIIFSPNCKEFTSKIELSSRLQAIYKGIKGLDEDINIYLICRGELETYEQDFEYFEEDDIFSMDEVPLYLLTSMNVIFPLYYQNNGIESCDSQLNVFITNKENSIKYIGNCEDLNLKKSFKSLIEEEDEINYIDKYPIQYSEFKSIFISLFNEYEKILLKQFEDSENELLYRPYVNMSYNVYSNFVDTKSADEKYVNHLRFKVLIKERHKDLITKNEELKEISKKFKSYGMLVQIIPIPCVSLEIGIICKKCGKDLAETDPFIFEQEENGSYCVECGETLENLPTFPIYFRTLDIDDEIIEEFFNINAYVDKELNPLLGNNCKICNSKLGNLYYINLTHFNLIGKEDTPLTPIDICGDCFEIIKNEEKFDTLDKNINFNKLGLSSKHMIYRKIFIIS